MLAVFDKAVAKGPEALKNLDTDSAQFSAPKDGSFIKYFNSVQPDSVSLNFGSSGFIAYSSHKKNPLLPRLFSVVDDIFCLFQGHIENIAPLKQQYGLTKTANEVSVVIEAYRTLRDRGPYPANHVVRDINGKFAFILYDNTSKSVFAAVDADGTVPFFWGMDSDNSLVLSDDEVVVKKACGKSFAPFPKGCFFTSSGGLRSFEFPQKELKATPWVDSLGEVCGSIFMVDEHSRKETGMPRVGSASNWSTQF
ncbi:stem-specific protein TSJT1-like isoform X2 [Olea europaea var. sylvestris]|uniref:stem-specific protein TSJT1-like isoform X2 n=1 Tax=Olea europaea var. sylvestris TaxID=158386 RepID=UPI000C1D509E|nr:stem-specific protein TSJT1-like isoform X2 [Olea europaea var. sylvestris]